MHFIVTRGVARTVARAIATLATVGQEETIGARKTNEMVSLLFWLVG
jgi:hypothetical protein